MRTLVINLGIWRLSNVSLKCRSVYQAANIAASWLVAETPPTSNARKFAEAVPRAATGYVNLNVTSVRRLRMVMQPLAYALVVLLAHITKVIFANECSSADICVASLVLWITCAIKSVPNRAGSSVATRNARRNAGSLVRRVWSRVNGNVPTSHVWWYAVRYVPAYPATRLANGDWIVVICVRPSAENLANSRHALHLDEIDLSSDNISERLIRLECGHIFTVQTLDSHCNMSEYYKLNAMGAFTATKTPPVDFQTPPSCPTCHGPITALRYGRVTKKANLDISEQNVVRTLSSTLEELGSKIESFSGRLDSVKDKVKLITFDPPSHVTDFDILSAHRRTRFGPESEPLSHAEISQASMTKIHGFSVEEGKTWSKVIRDLLDLYWKVVDVARTRGPHAQAYGAAVATLYRLELSAIASDPERASDTPEHAAMIEVNKKIGQPPHTVDTRFQVEAFFLSFELRYMLADIAQSRIEGLNVSSSDGIVLNHEHL
ncbi:hypothetical protein EDB83DRAFT_2651775 [Lactarius deliciosus]|nr:hypothetical protein EDB83DRAFT_2651775 [Lactarius deliciosus]